MGIRPVSSNADIFGSGTFPWERGSDPVLTATSASKVLFVGAFPYGPTGLVEPTSFREALDTLWPAGPDASFWEYIGYPWGRHAFYNIRGTTPAKATVSINDADDPTPKASLVATMREFGVAGNQYRITVSVNATTATSRDVTIYAVDADGNRYEEATYLAVQTSDGTVTDPGHPKVVLTAAGSADLPAVAGTYSLASGSNGTVAAASYSPGLNAGLGEVGGYGAICVLGVDSSIVGDVNDLLEALGAAAGVENKIVPLITPAGLTAATVQTEVAGRRVATGRAVLAWPQVKQTLSYSRGAASAVVTARQQSGHPLIACAVNRLDPWQAAMTGALESLTGSIVGLEVDNTPLTTINTLDDLGVAVFVRGRNNFTLNDEPTTKIDTGGLPLPLKSRRYLDYLIQSIAPFLETLRGKPLDVNYAARTLGPNTQFVVEGIESFLAREELAGRLIGGNPDGTTSPAFQVDAFTEASPTNLAQGRWDLLVKARETPTARQLVLSIQAGRVVTIREASAA